MPVRREDGRERESAADSGFRRYVERGDPEALARVFDSCAPRLYAAALRLTRDPAEAEDLVQETFLTAIEARSEFGTGRPLMPWLLGILTNRARHARRRAALRPPREAGPEPPPRPVDEAVSRELRAEVGDAIDGTAEPYRTVLVLHVLHGLTPLQVAHALARPAGTVRSQIARGLSMLRGKLSASVLTAVLAMGVDRGLSAARATVLSAAVASGGATAAPAAVAALAIPLTMVVGMSKWLLGVAVVCAALWLAWSIGPPVGGTATEVPHAEPAVTLAADVPAGSEVVDPAASVRAQIVSPTSPAGGVELTAVLVEAATGRPVPDLGVAFVAMAARPHADRLDVAEAVAGAAITSSDRTGRVVVPLPPETTGYLRLAGSAWAFAGGQPWGLPIAGVLADFDLGEVAVVPAARLRGVVLDEAGAGIEGASVVCVPADRPGLARSKRLEVETDRRGEFELAELGRGAMVLCVAASGYTPAQRNLYVIAGQAPPAQRLVLRTGHTLRGVVVDDRGMPVAGARVFPVHQRQFDQMTVRGPVEGCAVATGADGSFALGGMPPDLVTVVVRAGGHQDGRFTRLDLHRMHRLPIPRSAELHGRLCDTAGTPVVDAALVWQNDERDYVEGRTGAGGQFSLEVAPVRGTLRLGGESLAQVEPARGDRRDLGVLRIPVRGTIVVELVGPSPAVGVEVQLSEWSEADGPPGRRVASALARGGGARFDAVAPGAYAVSVEHGPWLAAPERVVVRAGETVRARVVAARGGTVLARLRTADGRPAIDREVVLSADADQPSKSERVGADGWVRFGPLAAGGYELALFEPGLEWRVFGSVVAVGGSAPVILRESVSVAHGETVRVEWTLPRRASVGGVVRDANGPVVGAKLVLSQAGGANSRGSHRTTHSGAAGQFAFEDAAEGTYELSYSRAGAPGRSGQRIELLPGEDRHVDCVLDDVPVTVRCVDARDGRPVPGARLVVQHDDGLSSWQAPSLRAHDGGMPVEVEMRDHLPWAAAGADGTIRTRVPRGVGELRCGAAGFATVTVRSGALPTRGVDLGEVALRPVARIVGTTRRQGALALDTQLYHRQVAPEETEWRPHFAPDGTFELRLEPGTHEVRAAARSSGPPDTFGPSVRVELAAGETERTEVEVPPQR